MAYQRTYTKCHLIAEHSLSVAHARHRLEFALAVNLAKLYYDLCVFVARVRYRFFGNALSSFMLRYCNLEHLRLTRPWSLNKLFLSLLVLTISSHPYYPPQTVQLTAILPSLQHSSQHRTTNRVLPGRSLAMNRELPVAVMDYCESLGGILLVVLKHVPIPMQGRNDRSVYIMKLSTQYQACLNYT